MRRFPLLVFLLLLALPALGAELPEVVAALEAPFKAGSKNAIDDMEAAFRQESRLTSLDRVQRGHGRVAMKFRSDERLPLAKFRWVYKAPTEQTIVSDGMTMWVYVPENRQVIESKIPTADRARSGDPLTFLTGLGNLSRDFLVAWAEPARDAQGNFILELRPRQPSPLIARILVTVDRRAVAAGSKVFPIVATNVIDPGGNSTRIEFSDIHLNCGLSDQPFRFAVPAGVEVVHPADREGGL